jgi:hypothetical protein
LFLVYLLISAQLNRAVVNRRGLNMPKIERKLMKIATILSVASAAVVLTSVGLASSYDELAAKGFRWVTVDGPYGCPSKDDLRQITKNRTDEIELRMVEQLRAYYLIPGGLVRLVQQDAASGMAQIHSPEIVTDLWTFSIFLSKRPIKNTYGEIETPKTSGLIRTETATD